MTRQATSLSELQRELDHVRRKLAEAEELIAAIRAGAVDGLVVDGPEGNRVYLLRDADRPYRVFVEEMQQGALTLSADGTICYSNRRMAEILRMPLERLRGRSVVDLAAVGSREVLQSLCGQARRGRCQAELALRAGDGGEVPAYVTANPLSNGDASIGLVVADLTEQKRHEQLVASEALTRSVLEQAVDAMIVCDHSGTIILANEAARRLCGANPLWQPFHSAFPLKTVPGSEGGDAAADVSLAPLHRGQTVEGLDVRLDRPDENRDLLLNAAPLHIGGADQPDGFVASLVDVTPLRVIQRALSASQHDIQEILSSITDVFFTLDRQWRFQEVNPAADRMFGKTREELLGAVLWKLFPSTIQTEFYRQCHRAMAEQRPMSFEIASSVQAGRWYEVHAYPSPERLSVYLRDITDRKQAEEDLRALNEDLERRIAQRTALAERRSQQLRALASELTLAEQRERRRLAQVLHDHLQQLLVAARMKIGSLVRRTEEPGLQESLAQIDRVVNQCIAESRSLTVELCPPVLYEGGLVAAVEWLARRMEEQHSLRVTVEAPSDIEPLDESVRVLLFQAARELLFNVVKHSRADQAEVVLRCEGRDQVLLSVCDRGVGFDAARLDAEGTASRFGLFSIRERVELLGGNMEVESGPGLGTRVQILAIRQSTMAAALPATDLPAARRGAAVRPAAAADRRRIRVLLADDHEILRSGLAGLLQEEPDLELVGEAADGHEAVELTLAVQPDVVLMDITMPRLNGIEATRAIRAKRPEVRVIGLSMHEDPKLTQMMREAGAVAYLCKSGPSTELIQTIRNQGRR